MKAYTKLYFESFGFDVCDFVPSEISGGRAVDIHHIECKGMGGSPKNAKDRIENLIALTREEHTRFGDKKQYMFYLYARHLNYMETHGVRFDRDWILSQLKKYAPDAEEYLKNSA